MRDGLRTFALILMITAHPAAAEPLRDRDWMTTATVGQVQARIEAGVDLTQEDPEWKTPLHIAAVAGNVPAIRALVGAGVDVNIRDTEFGATPLHGTAHTDAKKVVAVIDALVELGADVDAQTTNEAGDTPLHWIGPNEQDPTIRREALEALLRHAPDVNIKNNYGDSPTRIFVEYLPVDLMKTVLATGADVNITDRYGATMALIAANGRKVAMLKALVAVGADVNQANNNQLTPLHLAAHRNTPDVVEFLLDNGAAASITARATPELDSLTPYEVAARHGKHMPGTKALARLEALHKEAGLPEPEGGWATLRRVTGQSGEDR